MYAPALGFLMFAVGVNLNLAAFVEVFQHPKVRTDLLAIACRHWQGLLLMSVQLEQATCAYSIMLTLVAETEALQKLGSGLTALCLRGCSHCSLVKLGSG